MRHGKFVVKLTVHRGKIKENAKMTRLAVKALKEELKVASQELREAGKRHDALKNALAVLAPKAKRKRHKAVKKNRSDK